MHFRRKLLKIYQFLRIDSFSQSSRERFVEIVHRIDEKTKNPRICGEKVPGDKLGFVCEFKKLVLAFIADAQGAPLQRL